MHRLSDYQRKIRGWRGRSARKAFQRDQETACWEWQGAKTSHGYGISSRGLVHRLIYEEAVGPIPKSWEVHHECRNRPCANPNHLEALPPGEHRIRTAPKLTPEKAKRIVQKWFSGAYTLDELADEYGVSHGMIWMIKEGLRWPHAAAEYLERSCRN